MLSPGLDFEKVIHQKESELKRAAGLMQKCVEATEKWGAILVYPSNNRPEPPSLWQALHPRTPMRWTWDEGSDNRVGELWHFREQLSRSRKVVYSKWYQGRATFFSRDLFVALYAYARFQMGNARPRESALILEALRMDSPLSTKQVKAAAGLRGKLLEGHFNKAIKPLWLNFEIVGFGEIEDSSFPSLAHAATELVFEDLVRDSQELSEEESRQQIQKILAKNPKMLAAWKKNFGVSTKPSDK